MSISEKESKKILADTKHEDGSRTILFRSDATYTTKVRIAKRFKHSTLYSDNRLEIPPQTNIQKMERTK